MNELSPYADAARRAIMAAGGHTELARRLSIIRRTKITKVRVQQWMYKGVSPAFVIDVEALSGVPRTELRPDVFYPEAS